MCVVFVLVSHLAFVKKINKENDEVAYFILKLLMNKFYHYAITSFYLLFLLLKQIQNLTEIRVLSCLAIECPVIFVISTNSCNQSPSEI